MEKEFDLNALWQILKKRWKIIIVIPLIAASIVAAVNIFLITPQYKTSTTLIVMKPPDAAQILYQDIQVSRQLVLTYREIARSRRVLNNVISTLAIPYSVGQLRGQVEVAAIRDTEIITISVTNPDRDMARDIANHVARAFMSEVIEIMQVENVSIIDEATTPGSPVSPQVRQNVTTALLMGLIAAIGLAFLVEHMDRSISTPEEAQRALNLPVLGIIPRFEDK